MMTLRNVSQFPVDPATAWSLFESDEFRDRLEAETGIRGTIVEKTQQGAITITKLRYKTKTELPRMAAKLMGTTHLSYEQESRFNPDTSTLSWTVSLPGLGKRVKVHGDTSIHPHPDGCERVLEGTIEVKVRVVGGQLEKLVAGGFGKSMGRAVDVVRAMIRERGLG